MSVMEKILIVDDEAFICENLKRILEEERYHTVVAQDGQSALEFLQQETIDLVFLDLNLPDISGLEVLKKIKEWDANLLVIIITGYASVESAVEALKLGAYDYIKKPFKADVIKLIVRLALETQHLKREVHYLKKRHEGLLGDQTIIAESQVFRDVLKQARELAKHDDTTVLITGESGTGKEVIARAIHNLSARTGRPFLAINCAALPENLLESELFGHESGAFTDAKGRKIGLFEATHGGTIFLDEIGEMHLGLQAKLLRVLEDKKIRRLGGTQFLEVNLRIIAATNQDLREAVREKRFREDLFYRLHIVPIHLPPLRERPEDIIACTKTFLAEFARKYGRKFQDIHPEAQKLLLTHRWPGNVRELRHLIERICIMHDAETLQREHLPGELLRDSTEHPSRSASFHYPLPSEGISLDEVVDQFTAYLIDQAMQMTAGNVSQAAKLLGLPRGTLRYKLDR
jgi:two-component system, NtrC family, response regulator AtoC